MRFAIINASNNVEIVYEDYRSAHQEFQEITEPNDEWSIKPIMTVMQWARLPRDYRGYLNGRPAALYLDDVNGYTVYGYVYLIESWNTKQQYATYEQLVIPNLVYSPT